MERSLTHVLLIGIILAVTFNHASCATAGKPVAAAPKDNAPPYAAFGINLYHEILKEKPGKNVFISPASVGFALAMTYNGAESGTAEAMASVLGFAGRSREAVNSADSLLIKRTNEPVKGARLSVANSLWARQGLEFSREFLGRNERSYGAEVRSIDFANPQAAAQINAWVANKTEDKIREIVDQIDSQSILFLINAVYFKGTWAKEFDRSATRDDDFHLPGGAAKKHPLMRQSGDYRYLRGDGFQAASLPYGDGRMSMYVFLPDSLTGLDDFHAKLSAVTWSEWMKSFATRNGRIAFPRFKIEFEAKLKEALRNIGMGIAFDGSRANFRGMIKHPAENAYIHDVAHKTYVEVNEEGTEAAAVTSVEMRLTSVAEPERPFEMIVDHPFFFAIRDNETGLILFMGSIVDPR